MASPRLLLLALFSILFACGSPLAAEPATPTLKLPPRPDGAPTGSQFYEQIRSLPREEREAAILAQVTSGNVPDFLRRLVPVDFHASVDGQDRTLRVFVTPDYLAVGTDADFFRTPVGAPAAQHIADLTSATLPTRHMVNRFYEAAEVKLAPHPFHPREYQIDTAEVFWLSNGAIKEHGGHERPGALIAGIKKDVVITPRLFQPPGRRVAIYGWHKLDGQPIQPLYLGHVDWYHDYSHGIRLVAQRAWLDGAETSIGWVLADPTLAPLLSDEGPVAPPRYPDR